MAAGSLIGAALGNLAVAYAPVTFLRALLGCVLLAVAGKTFVSRLPGRCAVGSDQAGPPALLVTKALEIFTAGVAANGTAPAGRSSPDGGPRFAQCSTRLI
jgi:uncharacterized membrane protein YfcA